MMADVYAFGCMAYETLTGKVLFEADSEMAQISMHLAHDGLPPQLRELGKKPSMASLAELLFSTLRRDPRLRPNVTDLRRRLSLLVSTLARETWPFPG
jgi:serine/threonine protein kinase